MDKTERATVCAELQRLQRARAWHLKSRIKIDNRLRASIATSFGYFSGMTESDRERCFKEANALIKRVVKGEEDGPYAGMIRAAQMASDAFGGMQIQMESRMLDLAKMLPVAEWVGKPAQRGFGLHLLAVLIGETGDLANYESPGKIWRRMGCAPYEKEGHVHMGSTWNRPRWLNGVKLSKADWEDFGYSPRRRSIAYIIGENFVKQNGEGPYRRRYDNARTRFKELHENATKGHCHSHGMLLAAKLLMKNLWFQWNPEMVREVVY